MNRFSTLPAEYRTLCLALRNRDAAHEAALESAMDDIGDWSGFLSAAVNNHVVPLLAHGLGRKHMARMPTEVRDKLEEWRDRQSRKCLSQTAELIRLTGLFAKEGIRVLAVKGVALSQLLHGNLARRGFGDMDLLVDPAQMWKAHDLVLAAGYGNGGAKLPLLWQRSDAQPFIRDLPYRHSGGHLLELHQRLTDDPDFFPLDFETLWADRQEIPGWGGSVHTMSQRHLALYLCVHGAAHGWQRLCWLVDMATLLQSPEIAALALFDAEAMELRQPMVDVLCLCDALLGVRPVPGILSDIRGQAWVVRYCRWFIENGAWAESCPDRSLAWYRREIRLRWYRYRAKGRWRSVWSQFRADISYPVDWSLFRLPRGLRGLYPFLRPLGFLIRWIKG